MYSTQRSVKSSRKRKGFGVDDHRKLLGQEMEAIKKVSQQPQGFTLVTDSGIDKRDIKRVNVYDLLTDQGFMAKIDILAIVCNKALAKFSDTCSFNKDVASLKLGPTKQVKERKQVSNLSSIKVGQNLLVVLRNGIEVKLKIHKVKPFWIIAKTSYGDDIFLYKHGIYSIKKQGSTIFKPSALVVDSKKDKPLDKSNWHPQRVA